MKRQATYWNGEAQLILASITSGPKDNFHGGRRIDSFSVQIGKVAKDGPYVPVTRVIFAGAESRHDCGLKCRTATGSQCDCACGGRFHGIG